MKITESQKLDEFALKHASARGACSSRYDIVSIARWQKFEDIRETFNKVDRYRNQYIFDLANHYRLIAKIDFATEELFIIGNYASRSIHEGNMEKMNAYMELVKRFPLVPIRNLAELKAASGVIDELLCREKLLLEERDYLSVLADQVRQCEEKMYPRRKPSPVGVLKALMEVNDLKAVDLVPLFGTKSVVSEVLSGKRQMSKTHIANMAARFSLSPAAFFQTEPTISISSKKKTTKKLSLKAKKHSASATQIKRAS